MAINEIIKILQKNYPAGKCFLNYTQPHELLIATVLSAQCTDERVNIVTKDLFAKYTSVSDFANAELGEMEKDIHSIGLYHSKAKNIISLSRMLIEKFGGVAPNNIDDLVTLPGVGRKTANIYLGHIHKIPAIAVDTHVRRVAGRLGLTQSTDPAKIEQDLMNILPKSCWIDINQQLITLGRAICKARKPDCGICPLQNLCPKT